MNEPMLGQLAGLKSLTTAQLKQRWRELFDGEPPPYNRAFLETRIGYRIQELTYGGLPKKTIERLEALGDELDGGKRSRRRIRADRRPLAGTKLIREWKGIQHEVLVLREGFEWRSRPFKSLSAIARSITGTNWNGWTFFGFKKAKGSL